MKCIDCKWYAGQISDQYGVCKRFPHIENKSQQDWCGEFSSKVVMVTPSQKELPRKLEVQFVEPVDFEETTEYDITTDEIKPKRGRKPKNVD